MEEQEEEVGRSIYIYPHGGALNLLCVALRPPAVVAGPLPPHNVQQESSIESENRLLRMNEPPW